MRNLSLLFAMALACAACASPDGGRSTLDARVQTFRGRTPPELSADVRWLNAPPSTLSALRGRVVYVQFAFPT